MRFQLTPAVCSLLLFALLCTIQSSFVRTQPVATQAADTSPTAKSAPAADLILAVADSVELLDEALAAAEKYNEGKQARVEKNGILLAVVTLNLSLDETDHPLKSAAPQIYGHALELAKQSKNFQSAHAALDQIKSALAAKTADGNVAKPRWRAFEEIHSLMKKTSELQTSLRGLLAAEPTPTKQQQLLTQSATVVAIARVLELDGRYSKTSADAQLWTTYSRQFTSSALELNDRLHQADLPAAGRAFTALSRSCTTCHQKFNRSK